MRICKVLKNESHCNESVTYSEISCSRPYIICPYRGQGWRGYLSDTPPKYYNKALTDF